MPWRIPIPASVRRLVRLRRRFTSVVGRLTHRPRSRDELHTYWQAPSDAGNAPLAYAGTGHGRSAFLVELAKRHSPIDASVLEIGCNAGRNLDHLHRAGYTDLSAIEISQAAIDVFRSTYPAAAQATDIRVGAVEDAVRDFTDGQFDLVFTMAVLEHVHKTSEWVFPEIARITGSLLITIEDERTHSWRHFPRNYGTIFGALGMAEVEQVAKPLDLPGGFVARVFRKPDHTCMRAY